MERSPDPRPGSRNTGRPSSHAHCLLCGLENPRSLRLDFQAEGESGVKAFFQAEEKFQGYAGILHGGVICALLDAAMTHCVFRQGAEALTAEMNVRFLKPVSCRRLLEVTAFPVRRRGTLYHVQAELKQAGRLLARAQGAFIRKPEDDFAGL